MSIRRIPYTLSLLLMCWHALAADIAQDVRNGGIRDTGNGGYFELGIIGGYTHNPYNGALYDDDDVVSGLDIGGEYRYHNFFIEASQGSQDGLNIGYTFWSNREWSIDILGASINGLVSDEDDSDIHPNDTEQQRNAKLSDRDTIYVGAGLRATRYFDNYVLQYRLIGDIANQNGIVSTLRLGRSWQVRNWNLNAIVSAEYSSEKTNTYRFGVGSEDQTTRFPAYQPKESINMSVLFGVARPLSEHWVIRSFAGYIVVPETVNDSPLVADHDFSIAVVTLVYVF